MGDELDQSDIDSMSPDQQAQLAGLLGASSSVPEQNNVLARQLQLAQALRQPMPGNGHMAGRVFVGTGPLQALGAAASNVFANMQGQKALDKMGDNVNTQGRARTAMLAQILRQAQQGNSSDPLSQSYQPHGSVQLDPTISDPNYFYDAPNIDLGQ